MFSSSSKRLSSPQFHSPVAVPPAAALVVVSAGADVLGAVDVLADVAALADAPGDVDPPVPADGLAAWSVLGVPHAANRSTPTNKIPSLCFILVSSTN